MLIGRLVLVMASLCFRSGGMADTQDLLIQSHLRASSAQVATSRDGGGIAVRVAAGADQYPGVNLVPDSGAWRLSAFGHVEAKLVNTGPEPITLFLRVDNAGNWQDNPWNTEPVTLAPGQENVVTTVFGYAYGHKRGFALNPAAVVNVLLFTGKTDKALSFRIESVVAGGSAKETPATAPDEVRRKPAGGVISGPMALIASMQIRPDVGRLDLTDYNEVDVTLENPGIEKTVGKARIESNGGVSDWVSASVGPKGHAVLRVPFFHEVDLNLLQVSGLITSDAVSAIDLDSNSTALRVKSVRAVLRLADVPAWVGQRPPGSGAWEKTLDDEFDGTRLNGAVWKATGANYYDKLSHWSKEDVIVGGGVARLRYEKKSGHQNDDASGAVTPYAAGYLDSFGLWTQRYGYFEARMKLPKAPGLWPAFWMMPDRGAAAGEGRQDTGNGGMEFDIMEHLTRWGSQRYNIAMHYDGYEKDHKQLGSDRIYVEPDKDGFITCGLLWTPGSAEYYCNGVKVLSWKSPRVSNVPSMLMFTLPMGGWDNNDLDDSKLPADFVIDYLRVWQRKDLR